MEIAAWKAAAVFILRLLGTLGFLLYGMRLMSLGIQKASGEKMRKTLAFMTGNRFVAMLTGLIITMVIQSSGATSVMVISFVNASLITLRQAVGVIFGANIGTTVTAWIVALFGFNLDIGNAAVYIVGAGFFLTVIKRLNAQNLGEAVMGFGLLFMGLAMMGETFTLRDAARLDLLRHFQDGSALSLAAGVAAGTLITALIHSSSALTAIVITMAFNKILTWEFSCSMVIGSEMGSTIDAVLAAWGAKTDARRVAAVHVFINVAASCLALIFFYPLLDAVDAIVPGEVESNITYHIAMMHTLFKVIMVAIFLPFTKQLASLSERVIRQNKEDGPGEYRLTAMGKENAATLIIRAEKEIASMTDVATRMFDRIQRALGKNMRREGFVQAQLSALEQDENYADQMHYELCRFILYAQRLPVTEKQLNDLSIMMQVVDELELMTDDCLNIGLLLKRSIDKKMTFPQEDMDRLIPYVELARQFLQFIHININRHLDENRLSMAAELEGQIDLFRKNLKKTARKRLESGADVKAELLYIDIVRQVEKIGDRAFNISGLLAQTA